MQHDAPARTPIIWLDKACLNQSNIKQSLAGLPMYVAWSNTLLLLASSSYVKRLWCIMELFTWVQMGCPLEQILVKDIDGGKDLDEELMNFRVDRTRTYMLFDKHRLLAVIENAFGDHYSFDSLVEEIVQTRRGRAEMIRKDRSFGSFIRRRSATRRQVCRAGSSSKLVREPSSFSLGVDAVLAEPPLGTPQVQLDRLEA